MLNNHFKENGHSRSRTLVWIMLFITCLFPSMPNASNAHFSKDDIPAIVSKIETVYGNRAKSRAIQWLTLVDTHKSSDIETQIQEVNNFFNQLEFIDDLNLWGIDDYWTSVAEFIGAGGGDCEDFTLAKFYTLVFLGVPAQKLQMIYVNAITYQEAHMVLAYQESPSHEPVVLDNIDKQIKRASQRTDLEPIYAFNADELWSTKKFGQGQLVGKATTIKPWVRVMQSTQELNMAIPIINLDKVQK